MTPHNEANIEDISNIVLMPGDPLRSKYIAENFLSNVKLINSVRNMLSYTGTYKNKKITIFSSGMGMPSMGIYSYELFKFYNVDKIIRIGSCGAYSPDLNILDIILVNKSFTQGNFAQALTGEENHIIDSSFELNQIIKNTSKEKSIPIIEGNTVCSEVFDYYCDTDRFISTLPKDLNLIAAEMEAFALFSTAKLFNKEASCLLSVVDSHFKNEQISSSERETSLNKMIELALESSLKINT